MFAFLIHAREDKTKLAPIVRRLLDSNIKLWIDEPRDEGLQLAEEDIGRLAGHSVPGRKWFDERNKALLDAAAFITVLSNHSLGPGRIEIQVECQNADLRGRDHGVPNFFIGLESGALDRAGDLLYGYQGFKTFVQKDGLNYAMTNRGEQELALLIETVNAAISAPKTAPSRAADLPVSPYLADRHRQSEELLEEPGLTQSDQRVLPILLGRLCDRPDTFVRTYFPTKLAKPVFDSSDCSIVHLPWPHGVSDNADRAAQRMINGLQGMVADPALPLIVHAQPRREDLAGRVRLQQTLDLWCRVWERIFAEPGEVKIVPILDLRLDFVSGFRRAAWFLPSKQHLQRQISRIVAGFEHTGRTVRPMCLTPLDRITPHCAEAWLQADLLPQLDEHLRDWVPPAVLQNVDARGLAMEDWAKMTKTAFGSIAKG